MFSDEEHDEDEHLNGLDVDDFPESQEEEEEEFHYEILDANQIVENMVNSIREVNSVAQLNFTVTRILLNYFQWDKERLYERLFDGSRDVLFKEARVTDTSVLRVRTNNTTLLPSETNDPSTNSNAQQIDSRPESCGLKQHEAQRNTSGRCAPASDNCPICFSDDSKLVGLDCGHDFCQECWVTYLSTKIMEEGQSGRILCPAHNCVVLVDDQTVLPLMKDSRVKRRYQQLITNSYVEFNKNMRWCPKPECGHAVKVANPDFRPVRCNCGTIFCFLCGDSWHEPVKCDLIRKWKKKCDDDSETSNWIAANTKECPKCRVTIEKNGGCNHMICKNSDCKAEFCWVCLGGWNQHGSSWYSCNRYDETDGKAARDAQERSRALLQRYLFYCKRYMNHMASLKFENKLYASIKEKMRDMQQHNSIIFEDNQRDLEAATETLSEYLERDITSDNIRDIKQKVQDKSRYCASRRTILLEHVQEGYERDCWILTD